MTRPWPLVLLLAACFQPQFTDGMFVCDERDPVCPPDFVCVAGRCLSAAGAPDLATDVVRRVFATSALYNGNLGGLAGADMKCQGLASAAGLHGSYKAWLSSKGGTPQTRMVHGAAPYVLLDGTQVAADWAGLTSGRLLHAINQTESRGAPPTGNTLCGNGMMVATAWTDTTAAGALGNLSHDCAEWTDSSPDSPSGDWGQVNATDNTWSDYCAGSDCSKTAVLYCVEQ